MASYSINGEITVNTGDTVAADITAALNTGLPNNATLVAPTDNFVAMIAGCIAEVTNTAATGSAAPTGTFAYSISGTTASDGEPGASLTVSVTYTAALPGP